MSATVANPACNSSTIFYGYGNRANLSSKINPAMLFIAIFVLVCSSICAYVFIRERPYYDRLKVRQTFLVFMSLAGICAQVVSGPLADLSQVSFDSFPCWVRLLIMVLVPILIGSSILLRMMIFHFMSNLTRMAIRRHKELIETEEKRMGPIRRSAYALRMGFASLFWPIADSKSALISLRFLISTPGQATVAFVIAIPYLLLTMVVALVVPEYRNGCTGCKLFPNIFVVFTVATLGFLVSGFLVYLKIRNENDYWGLGREIGLSFGALLLFAAVGFFLSFLVDTHFQVLQTLGFLLFFVPQTIYPVYLAQKIEGRRKVRKPKAKQAVPAKTNDLAPISSMGAGTSQIGHIPGGITVKLIMQSPELFAAFEAHITRELAAESLLFLKDIHAWKEGYETNPQRDELAKRFYDTYIKVGSVLEINISSEMRKELEELIKLGSVPRNTFDAIVKDITFIVQTGPLARFANSPECASVMSKLNPMVKGSHVSQIETVEENPV